MERPMNTAGKYRSTQAVIEEHIRRSDKRHTPVTRIKVNKDKVNGTVNISVYTSKPDVIRLDAKEIETELSEASGGRQVKLAVIPESRSVAKFVRVSPRKARLVIAAIKGKRVSDALDILKFVPNHAAGPIYKVIKSAAANAHEGWGASLEELKVSTVIADGGPLIKRIRARAQGRAYKILKRTTHLTVVLLEVPAAPKRPAAKPKAAASAEPGKAKSSAKKASAKSSDATVEGGIAADEQS